MRRPSERPSLAFRPYPVATAAISAAFALLSSGCSERDPGSDARGRGPAVVVSVEPRAELSLELPDFELVDQAGKKRSKSDLAGKVWIADFIFTTCPSICPRLTEKMSALSKRTVDAPDLRYVSFTVDPETDTPEALAAFGAKYGADTARWSFLTGEPKHVEDVVLKGFKQVLSRDSGGMIFHSERFVLVDKRGKVRGFYETEPHQLDALEKRARELLTEP
jgi:protein SCO1